MTSKQARPSSGTDVYPHMPIPRPHAARLHERRVTFTSAHLYGNVYMPMGVAPRSPIRPILGLWGAKFTEICDSLPRTPMNRRAKCDAASFILGGEIRNHRNKHTNKQNQVRPFSGTAVYPHMPIIRAHAEQS